MAALNICDKGNSSNTNRNSQISLTNFSFFRVIHYNISFLSSRTKPFLYKKRYNKHTTFILFLICEVNKPWHCLHASKPLQDQLRLNLESIPWGIFLDGGRGVILLEQFPWTIFCPPKLMFIVHILSI